jgi:hypothetical protein
MLGYIVSLFLLQSALAITISFHRDNTGSSTLALANIHTFLNDLNEDDGEGGD